MKKWVTFAKNVEFFKLIFDSTWLMLIRAIFFIMGSRIRVKDLDALEQIFNSKQQIYKCNRRYLRISICILSNNRNEINSHFLLEVFNLRWLSLFYCRFEFHNFSSLIFFSVDHNFSSFNHTLSKRMSSFSQSFASSSRF